MTLNVLHLVPDFNYVDGRSYYVYLLLKYLQRSGVNVLLCTNKGDSLDRVRELGIQTYTRSSLSRKAFLPKSVSYLSGIVKEHNVNIIHTHHRYYEMLAGIIKRRQKKIHTVLTALSLVKRRYGIEYKSDRIIAVSKAVRKMLIETFKVNPDKISLIPNFADSEEMSNAKQISGKTRVTEDVIKLLSIGRFHKEKNFEIVIEAVSLLKDINAELILVGSGIDETKYRKLINDKKISAGIYAPQKDLSRFFEVADMCVLSSTRDPLPTFMLQSGLFHKPFIGSDVDGIAEVIDDGVNGLLFQSGNSGELAEKITLLLQDKSLALSCSERLHELVCKKYTEKSVIPEILEIYKSFLINK